MAKTSVKNAKTSPKSSASKKSSPTKKSSASAKTTAPKKAAASTKASAAAGKKKVVKRAAPAFDDMKKDELLDRAKKAGIKGRSKMAKKDLVAALRAG